jgi:hypothetical protein
MARHLPILLVLAQSVAVVPALGADDLGRWHAGPYSFSDEMGGFTIREISGTGSAEDPVVLIQEMASASPVTLVVRAEKPVRARDFSGNFAHGFIHMQIVALNNSGLPWLEFEFELQEIVGEPSTFGDGLSFDQRRTESSNISSDRYAEYSRDFEPYDRLIFRNGFTDPLQTVTFRIFITDFTPRWEFFLVQDPTVPFS